MMRGRPTPSRTITAGLSRVIMEDNTSRVVSTGTKRNGLHHIGDGFIGQGRVVDQGGKQFLTRQ